MENHATAHPYGAAFGHPAFCNLLSRIMHLSESGVLTAREDKRACYISGNLETLATWYWRDLNALAASNLPDPGCRPNATAMHPYADREPDFNRVLGFFHKCREFVQRCEAKYGFEGGE